MQERDAFKAQVGILKTHLLLLNIPLPPGIDGSLAEPSPTFDWNDTEMASVSYRMDESSHQRLHVDWMAPSMPEVPHMSQPVNDSHQVSASPPILQDQGFEKTPLSLPEGKIL